MGRLVRLLCNFADIVRLVVEGQRNRFYCGLRLKYMTSESGLLELAVLYLKWKKKSTIGIILLHTPACTKSFSCQANIVLNSNRCVNS
jgi:hypothetical protein